MSNTRKVTIIIAVLFCMLYFASPVDVVPDVPVVGHLDDIIVPVIALLITGLGGDDKKED